MYKIYKIEWPDDFGQEWLCLDNLNICLRTKESIGPKVKLKVTDVTGEQKDATDNECPKCGSKLSSVSFCNNCFKVKLLDR